MSRREDIDNSIWSDPDFLTLSPEAKLTFIWSWTNSRCGMAGLYKVAPVLAQVETGLDETRLQVALEELAAANFAHFDNGVIWVRSRVRKLRQKTVQIAKSIRADVERVAPAHPLRVRFLETYSDAAWLRDELANLDPQVRVTRPSSDPHPDGSTEPKKVTLTRPSGEGQVTLQGNGKGKGLEEGGPGETADAPSPDFPEHLRDTLPQVVSILQRIAAAREAKPVTMLATSRAMASYPRRPHVKAAEDLEHWLVHGTGTTVKVRDVVGFFRNQLDKRHHDVAKPANGTGRPVAAIRTPEIEL